MKKLSILVTILFLKSFVYAQIGVDINKYPIKDKITTSDFSSKDLFNKSDSVLLNGIKYRSNEEITKFINTPKTELPELTDKIIEAKLKEIPTTLNIRFTPEVGVLVRNYLYNSRTLMVKMLTKSEYYFPLFEEELDKRGMPLELKYLAVIESQLNPRAVSPQGATGLWQFMYATAKYKGLTMTSLEDERRDPLISTQYAADYLKQLYSIYGDWLLAMSAYNSGAGNINKAVSAANGIKNYWIARKYMPYETQQYVPKIIAMLYAMHYAHEFLLFPSKPEYHFLEVARVKVYDRLTLKYSSELLSIDEDELSALNPILSKNLIPKCDTGYCLIIPRERLSLFEENKSFFFNDPYLIVPNKELEDKTVENYKPPVPKTVTTYKTYTVKSGDNLGLIAQKFGVSVSDLKKWNGLNDSYLSVGKNLKIYSTKQFVAEASKTTVNTASNVTKVTNDNVGLKSTETVTTYKTYIVKSGDNLGFIAQKFGVSVSDLKKWNGLNDSFLSVGKNLKIYSTKAVVAEVAKPSVSSTNTASKVTTAITESNVVKVSTGSIGFKSSEIDTKTCRCHKHEIVSGDTLWGISAKYNTDIEKIKAANNIPKGWVMKVGTYLKIPKA